MKSKKDILDNIDENPAIQNSEQEESGVLVLGEANAEEGEVRQ